MASMQVNDHTFWLSRFHLLSGHNYKDIILFYSPSLNDRLCACLACEALPDLTSSLAVLPSTLPLLQPPGMLPLRAFALAVLSAGNALPTDMHGSLPYLL